MFIIRSVKYGFYTQTRGYCIPKGMREKNGDLLLSLIQGIKLHPPVYSCKIKNNFTKIDSEEQKIFERKIHRRKYSVIV